jgi:hypothetical protein
MSQKVNFSTPELTSPAWAGDYLDRASLIPGGAKINASLFSAVNGKKYIPSGTLLGRTLAERDAGTGFGPATVASDDEIYLLAFDVTDAVFNDDCELYRHKCVVKENFLPGYSGLPANDLLKIQELYTCTLGAN